MKRRIEKQLSMDREAIDAELVELGADSPAKVNVEEDSDTKKTVEMEDIEVSEIKQEN